MLASMTGFSSYTLTIPLERDGGNVAAVIEIKSLNTKFFEATCKLPTVLNSLEIEIINRLKQRLHRGRVFFAIRLSTEAGLFETINPSFKVVEQYLATAELLKSKYGITVDLTASSVMQLPDVFEHVKQTPSEAIVGDLMKGLEVAIDRLIESRNREGEALTKDLHDRFEICERDMLAIEADFEVVIKVAKDEVAKLLEEVTAGKDELKPKLEEAYAQLNRMDIHEEITRFKSHLSAIKQLLAGTGHDNGRKLDFILQELMRETNTITAKCSTYKISALAVNIKVELEKAREQAQNIV